MTEARDRYDGRPYFCDCGEVHPSSGGECDVGGCTLESSRTAELRRQRKRPYTSALDEIHTDNAARRNPT